MEPEQLTACGDCDLLQRVPPMARGARARCGRCGGELYREAAAAVERAVALCIAGLVLLALLHSQPLMSLQLGGAVFQTTILGGVRALYDQGYPLLCALVLITALIAPLAYLAGLLYVLLPLGGGRAAPLAGPVYRLLCGLQQWIMLDVFLLGLVVSAVKLRGIAAVEPGTALFALFALILVISALMSLERHQVWTRLAVHR